MHTSLSLFIKVSSSLHARVARHRGVLTCNPKPMAARLWLDVDVGVDDAQGLILALSQNNVEVVGISAVHGNVEVEKVSKNIGRVLTLCDREEVPFYVGAASPFLAPAAIPTYYFGKDGLGDVPHVGPPTAGVVLCPNPGHAAVHMAAAAAAAAQSGRGITIVATGPLTNLALAAKIHPDFPQNVKEVVVMGGAEEQGNATLTAEYNFWWDPEAAHIVIHMFPRVTLLTWDCCLRHRQPWSILDTWLDMGTRKSVFLAAVMHKTLEKERRCSGSDLPQDAWIPCDPLAMALSCDTDALLIEAEEMWCRVELKDGPDRARSFFARRHAAHDVEKRASTAPRSGVENVSMQGRGSYGRACTVDIEDAVQAFDDANEMVELNVAADEERPAGQGWGRVRVVRALNIKGFEALMASSLI